jgi:xylose isomerase
VIIRNSAKDKEVTVEKFFPEIKERIPYDGPRSKNPLAFRYYNPAQVVGQKTMEEHLRFSVAYWHTFKGTGQDPFGDATFSRSWNRGSTPIKRAEKRLRAAFEFFLKLGIPFYCS